jgi:hypothetical protein
MTASHATDQKRRSQRAPIARNRQARTNAPLTALRGAIDPAAKTILQNNERRPRRQSPVPFRAEPRFAALAAAIALKSP